MPLLYVDLTASSRGAAPAEEMDEKKNHRDDKQKVNERGGHVEHDECPNPREEQKKRDGKKYKPHENPFSSVIVSRFNPDSLARLYLHRRPRRDVLCH
jgi:hypothetical protein